MQETKPAWTLRAAYLALAVLCACLFTCTAPARITYPDDEIVFQTTQSLAERGSFAIPGIAKRSGERRDRPKGTFGWAPGRDGKRYGFFGHGLSVAAVPLYALADATADRVPETWRHVQRSNLPTWHTRGPEADWQRGLTSLTNCLLTPLAALLLGLWLGELGYRPRTAVLTALIYALGTTAWPYAGTFLSEPLSALMLLGAAWAVARWRSQGSAPHLWVAATLVGLTVHVHVLNLLATPAFLAYAAWPEGDSGTSWRARILAQRRAWIVAACLGAFGLGLLGLSQALRYGSPFETGRFDHYAHWEWPLEHAFAMVVAPGRSLWIYSPPLIVALLAWPQVIRERRAVAVFVLALFALRWLFVACRSDWFGGWAIGPRYLVPVVPFLLLPLAELFERGPERPWPARLGLAAAMVVSVLFQAWLAVHSVVQVLFDINRRSETPGSFRHGADWTLDGFLPLAYWRLEQPALEFWLDGKTQAAMLSAQLEALAFGSWRLSSLGHAQGLWHAMIGLGLLAGVAGVGLTVTVRLLAKEEQRRPQ